MSLQKQIDDGEEADLIERFGPTVQRDCQFELDEAGFAFWQRLILLDRRSEVVMIVQHPDGRLLLHTKGHYPPETYRLPTGGILWGERVLDALAREQQEELGHYMAVLRMPGILRYHLYCSDSRVTFASYLFILKAEAGAVPNAQDLGEGISDFRWIEPNVLPAVADWLRGQLRTWGRWGEFRALAHEFLAQVW